jgi:hypothetical protein
VIHPDLLVGTVALGISIFAIGSAIFNWEPAYELRTPRWLESRWGRGRTRIILGVIGMVLFCIGFYLIYGLIAQSATKSRPQGKYFPSKAAHGAGDILTEAV